MHHYFIVHKEHPGGPLGPALKSKVLAHHHASICIGISGEIIVQVKRFCGSSALNMV